MASISLSSSRPQPFDVETVVVCGISYPQKEVSDKFFVDRTSFFVNVKQEVSQA